MKICAYSCVVWLILVFIDELLGRYLLVKISKNEAIEEISSHSQYQKSTITTGDWMSFQKAENYTDLSGTIECEVKHPYWGDPDLGGTDWDYGTMKDIPGPHMICDLNGNGLKWNEVGHGMEVKIKAKNVHHPGYEWLYQADGGSGNGYIYYDYEDSTGREKQIWKVLKDSTKGDSNILFESVYWPGWYLSDGITCALCGGDSVLCTACPWRFCNGTAQHFEPRKTWWIASTIDA